MNPSERERVSRLETAGWGVIPPDQYRIDIDSEFLSLWKQVNSYTMTSLERGFALYKGVEYVCRRNIPGDFVECGVWRGGSCLLMALTLEKYKKQRRKIFLYDTFTGMTEPTDNDRIASNGKSVIEKWNEDLEGEKDNFKSWIVGLDEVKNNIQKAGCSDDIFVYVKGDVRETLKVTKPGSISLLRLDTDWYESTAAELKYLYPLLSEGGVLLIDDYGHFTGAKKAVDEYFLNASPPILLNRVDYTGRIGIKF